MGIMAQNKALVEQSSISGEEHLGDSVVLAKKIIAEDSDTKFVHISLYNSLDATGSTADGVQALIDIYSNLMSLHGFMAGFQFVALDGDVGGEDLLDQIIFILRFVGFGISLFGTVLCLVVVEYLKTIQQEQIVTQVKGLLKYKNFIQIGDHSAISAVIILSAASSLILWKKLPFLPCIILNATSIMAILVFIRAFYVIIMRRQENRKLYHDEDFLRAKQQKRSCNGCNPFKSFMW